MKTITINAAKVNSKASKAQVAYMRKLGLKTDLFDNRIINSLTSEQASEIINDLKRSISVELKMA